MDEILISSGIPSRFLTQQHLSSGRVPWRAFWRPSGSSRRSSTLKASGWTAPSERTWSQLAARPAPGSGPWRPSGPGAWRSTRPCSWRGRPRAPCWRRSGRTSTLTTRCSTWRERPRWGPSLPTCPTALHRNTAANRRAARRSSLEVHQTLENVELVLAPHLEMHHFQTVRAVFNHYVSCLRKPRACGHPGDKVSTLKCCAKYYFTQELGRCFIATVTCYCFNRHLYFHYGTCSVNAKDGRISFCPNVHFLST